MKGKHLLILTLIIISCLSIGLVSAADDGVNETISTASSDLKEDTLETGIVDDIIGEDESDETLERPGINPISPSSPGSLTDLKNRILGGVCTLDRNYTYKEGDPTDGIEINSTLILIGNNYTIDGGNVTRLFVINNGSLYISEVNFVNAYAKDNGAAIYYNGTSGFINNCTFTNCTANLGGAIYYDGLSLVVNNTRFCDNSAKFGAGMYIISNSTIIINSTFSNNRVGDTGGAVYWKKTSKAIRPSQESGSDGGSGSYVGSSWAIAIGQNVTVQSRNSIGFGSNINITNSEFSFCMGRNSNVNNSLGSTVIVQGMSIQYVPPVNLSYRGVNISNLPASSYYKGLLVTDGLAIVDSTFLDNYAGYAGGSIAATTGLTNVNNSIFKNSKSGYGGALYTSDLNIHNSKFLNNWVTTRGGAIFTVNSGEANIYNSEFRNNSAYSRGGAIDGGYSKKLFKVYNSLFVGNQIYAQSNMTNDFYGGAVAYVDVIHNCVFLNNSAPNGGAVYNWNNHVGGVRMDLRDSVFINNTGCWGGAVLAHYSGNIVNCNFTSNHATWTGGGVSGWNPIIQGCIFKYNSADFDSGACGGESIRVYQSIIINNTAGRNGGGSSGWNIVIRDCLYENNSAKSGGAIFSEQASVYRVRFINNHAVNGGGIYHDYGNLYNNTFIDNAAELGGSIYVRGTTSKSNNVYDNVIKGSNAKDGGAIFVANSYATTNIYSNNISNTKAVNGGAIYANANAFVNDNNFNNVEASGLGGAIYNNHTLSLSNNKIMNSKANLGKDIYNALNISISYLTFIDNATLYASYKDKVLIFANLTDDMGNTITGQNISVTINGNHYSLETIEGAVSFNYTVDFMSGEKVVNGTYDGSKLENTVIKSGLIRINPPELSIIKTVDDKRYYEGDIVVYTVIINNTGKGKAINVMVRDNLPQGLQLINSSSNKGIFINNVWNITVVDVGEVINISYTCLLTSYGPITNVAIGECENGDEKSSSVTINVRPYQPNIAIEKIALKPVVIVGQKAEFEILLHNTENVAVKGLTVTEDSFEGLVFDSYRESPLWKHSIVNGKNVWTLVSDFAPKETVSLFVYFNTTAMGTFNNTIVVNSTVLENKTANASVKVLYPHLNSSKVSLMPITKVGNQTMFEIIIFNDGEFDVHNVYIIEDSFEGLTYKDYLHDDLWRHEVVDGKNKWTMVEELPPGETIGLFVTFDTSNVGNFTNYAIVGSDETVSKTVNATVWVNETVHEAEDGNPNLEVKITALHPLVVAGSQIKFEVIVLNNGDVVLNNVTISENSFNGLIFDHIEDHTGIWYQTGSLSASGLLAASDDELSWKMNMPLYRNEALGFFMVFNTTNPGTFVNSIVGSSDKTEPKIASDEVEVVVPQYVIEKVALNKTVTVGDKVYFEITVKNTGKVNITDLTIIEMPEEGLTYDSFIDSQGFWSEGANFTWSIRTNITPNETVTLFVIFNAEKVGNLTNTVASGDITANATVEVKNKTNQTTPDNSTPGDDEMLDDEPIDDDLTSGDDEPTEDDSDKYETDNETGNADSSLRTSAKVDKNATGNPILLLLLVVLTLILPRRNEK